MPVSAQLGFTRSWAQRLAEFYRLTAHSKLLLIRAVLWLGLARLAVVLLPLHAITPYLGRHMEESCQNNTPQQQITAEQISWAVKTMQGFTPWDSNCMAQAIAAKRMLQRVQIPSTLYIGVARKEAQELEAHAWLRSGTLVVTGAEEMARYKVMSKFS